MWFFLFVLDLQYVFHQYGLVMNKTVFVKSEICEI